MVSKGQKRRRRRERRGYSSIVVGEVDRFDKSKYEAVSTAHFYEGEGELNQFGVVSRTISHGGREYIFNNHHGEERVGILSPSNPFHFEDPFGSGIEAILVPNSVPQEFLNFLRRDFGCYRTDYSEEGEDRSGRVIHTFARDQPGRGYRLGVECDCYFEK